MSGWFTPTELRVLLVLNDGKPHPIGDLIAVLPDDQGGRQNVRRHIANIRKLLLPWGHNILSVWHQKRFCYQQVRLLSHSCRCVHAKA